MHDTMKKAPVAVAIAAIVVSVAALLLYGSTSAPDEADPVMPNDVAPQQGAGQAILSEADVVPANTTGPPRAADAVIHFMEDPAMLDTAISQAAGVIGGEPAAIPDAIAAANNGFAVDFYREVSAKDGNIFFSPASMFVAFSTQYEGARGNTADQMQQVFGFEPDLQARYNVTAHLMSSVNRDDPNATLEMANALWPAVWFAPYDSYVDAVRSVYLADVERVDFADGGVDRINAWASEKTHGKIEEVITHDGVDDSTALLITNAIYFKGMWTTPFPETSTHEGDFWRSPSESIKTDFMYAGDMRIHYASLGGVQIIRMPYEGDRLSMLVVLPEDANGLSGLEETVSVGQVEQWGHSLGMATVGILMPKFTITTLYNLPAHLKSLGMTDAFDGRLADLSGIAPAEQGRNLYVSEAIHKAYVDVNEKGTEAAAVTAIGDSHISASEDFIADHPFIFIIQDDESGTILFMGRLSDPTA